MTTPVNSNTPGNNGETSGGLGRVLLAGLTGLGVGVGGYALGKEHGRNEGYQDAKAEDMSLIRQNPPTPLRVGAVPS